jgi:hypothetical protein
LPPVADVFEPLSFIALFADAFSLPPFQPLAIFQPAARLRRYATLY